MEELYRISTNYFCAGLVVKNGIVIKTAPILKWTLKQIFDTICFKGNYSIEKIK